MNIKINKIHYIQPIENPSVLSANILTFCPQKFQKNREKSVPVQIYQGKKEPSDCKPPYFDLKSTEKVQDSTFSVESGQKCLDKNEKNACLIKGKWNFKNITTEIFVKEKFVAKKSSVQTTQGLKILALENKLRVQVKYNSGPEDIKKKKND